MILSLIIALGSVNPVVTQDNIQQTICRPGWAASVRPSRSWSGHLKHKLLRSRVDRNPAHYQLDHQVPLEVGGAPLDLANLSVQPLGQARIKDRLEHQINRDVCAGRMTLAQGQAVFLN